jgi:ABC-2 type transport system ATP-binding protein
MQNSRETNKDALKSESRSEHPESMPYALEVSDLRFRYARHEALRGVSFAVRQNSLFGLLGPNGGGKTTLFRIICTLLKPDSGQATILGCNLLLQPGRARSLIGVVFQSSSLDIHLTPYENLAYHGRLYGITGKQLRDRVEEGLVLFGLTDRKNELVRTLSGGLRRRLEVAKALLHRPRVLVLDEPTTGLDPKVRHELWRYLLRLKNEENITVLVTTHLLEEAERCDQLVILNEGKLVADGTPDDLKRSIGGDVIVIHCRRPENLRERVEAACGCRTAVVDGTLRLETSRGHELVARLMESFAAEIDAVTVGRPTLEDVFIHETGHRFFEKAEESMFPGVTEGKEGRL